MPYHVYILRNPDGETSVGQTNDFERRLFEHNDPTFHGTWHTKRHCGPWALLRTEEFQTRPNAMRRERELKTGKGRDFIKTLLAGGC